MPKYAYLCPKCGIVEKLEKFDAPAKQKHDCGAEMKRQFSTYGLIVR